MLVVSPWKTAFPFSLSERPHPSWTLRAELSARELPIERERPSDLHQADLVYQTRIGISQPRIPEMREKDALLTLLSCPVLTFFASLSSSKTGLSRCSVDIVLWYVVCAIGQSCSRSGDCSFDANCMTGSGRSLHRPESARARSHRFLATSQGTRPIKSSLGSSRLLIAL